MRFDGTGLNRPSEMERYERTGKANHGRATGSIPGGQPIDEETQTLGLTVAGGSHGCIPMCVCGRSVHFLCRESAMLNHL